VCRGKSSSGRAQRGGERYREGGAGGEEAGSELSNKGVCGEDIQVL
jgi:hypothetical protein